MEGGLVRSASAPNPSIMHDTPKRAASAGIFHLPAKRHLFERQAQSLHAQTTETRSPYGPTTESASASHPLLQEGDNLFVRAVRLARDRDMFMTGFVRKIKKECLREQLSSVPSDIFWRHLGPVLGRKDEFLPDLQQLMNVLPALEGLPLVEFDEYDERFVLGPFGALSSDDSCRVLEIVKDRYGYQSVIDAARACAVAVGRPQPSIPETLPFHNVTT